MLNGKLIQEGITFDDVLLVPQKSTVLPSEVSLKTQLTKNITLNIPILSAAMDTVTEHRLATTLALEGGLGFIHKNLTIEQQADQVRKVKEFVVDSTNPEHADACVDTNNRLCVGAAVGVSGETMERVTALVEAGVDVVTVDSAHGHSMGVINTIRTIRENFPTLDIIGGNIVTPEAAKDLIEAGANALKVGVGPGSICTTRVIAGVGVPQITAVNNVYEIAKHYGVSVIADGGIKLSGDIVKAIAAGASVVMLGGLLAGCEETPGEVINLNGARYKTYVGMGSLAAMERGSKDRYFQNNTANKKLVPEGIEGVVKCKGELRDTLYQLIGGLRSGMGYCGTGTIDELKVNGKFVKITGAGLKESHPHDVTITKEAPNYRQ